VSEEALRQAVTTRLDEMERRLAVVEKIAFEVQAKETTKKVDKWAKDNLPPKSYKMTEDKRVSFTVFVGDNCGMTHEEIRSFIEDELHSVGGHFHPEDSRSRVLGEAKVTTQRRLFSEEA
jgi:hypothetical protein